MEDFYDLVRGYFNDGDSLLNYVKEIRDIECILNKEDTIYNLASSEPRVLIGAKFTLDSNSWQVRQAKANGHYEVEKLVEDSDERFYVRNLDTNDVYISDIENLSYLISHEGHQNYRFVYVGWCGDYRFLG